MFGSAFWGENISKFDRAGRLEKIVKKKKKNLKKKKKKPGQVGKPLDSFKTTRKETVQDKTKKFYKIKKRILRRETLL